MLLLLPLLLELVVHDFPRCFFFAVQAAAALAAPSAHFGEISRSRRRLSVDEFTSRAYQREPVFGEGLVVAEEHVQETVVPMRP